MKAFEFQAMLNAENALPVPQAVVEQLQGQPPLRVIVLVADENDEDREWARLTSEQFLKGYDDADAIYDNL